MNISLQYNIDESLWPGTLCQFSGQVDKERSTWILRLKMSSYWHHFMSSITSLLELNDDRLLLFGFAYGQWRNCLSCTPSKSVSFPEHFSYIWPSGPSWLLEFLSPHILQSIPMRMENMVLGLNKPFWY